MAHSTIDRGKVSLWTFSCLVPLHGTKYSHCGKKMPICTLLLRWKRGTETESSGFLFLFLFSTTCFSNYICCAAGQIVLSSLGFLERHNYPEPIFTVRKPQKTASFCRLAGKPCGALLGRSNSPSVYALIRHAP